MIRVETIGELRARLGAWRQQGATIGFVPTMGALHEGHLSLVDIARQRSRHVVASLFVNPTQFGVNEDFRNYPRDEERDLRLLKARGCELVFAPPVDQLYPDGTAVPEQFRTTITVGGLGDGLCGLTRPGHFTAVATQVMKLLMLTLPDVAVFGEKDYQQLVVVRTMVRELNVPVDIVAGPTVREADGLAMSSRNAYLTPDERAQAPLLHRTLLATREHLNQGVPVDDALAEARRAVIAGGIASVDYISVVDDQTLRALPVLDRPARLVAAVRLGRARLIDNIAIPSRAIATEGLAS